MLRQNGLLREHALGKFRPLLQAISRDPAMLVWLDSNSNVKGKPNENYARELMELFSLGVGNYTEKDIREAARAFTGWHTDGERLRVQRPPARRRRRRPSSARPATWDGGDVVRIVPGAAGGGPLPRPQAVPLPRQRDGRRRPTRLLEPLCEPFRKSDYDIAALVRTMLASRHFFSAHAFRQRIKGPVEYVLGAVQAVYRRYGEADADYRPLPQQVLVRRLAAMGQALFAPPNVKGWPGGPAWLNTSTVLARDNFAAALAMGTLWPGATAGDRRVPPAPGPRRRTRADRRSPTCPRSRRRRRRSTRPGSSPRRGSSRPEEVVRVLLDPVPARRRPPRGAARSSWPSWPTGEPAGPALARRVPRGRPRDPDDGRNTNWRELDSDTPIDGSTDHVHPPPVPDPHAREARRWWPSARSSRSSSPGPRTRPPRRARTPSSSSSS